MSSLGHTIQNINNTILYIVIKDTTTFNKYYNTNSEDVFNKLK